MKIKRLACLILALSLWAPAALAQEVARGRYVQEKVDMPQNQDIHSMTVDEQGRLALLMATGTGAARATLGADGAWDTQSLPWGDKLEAYGGWNMVSGIDVRGDQAYLAMFGTAENANRSQVLRGEGDQLTPMDMTHVDEDMSYISGITGAQEMVILQDYDGAIYGYDFATGERRAVYDRANGEMYLADGKLYALSRQEKCALVFDVASGELLYEMADAPLNENNALYAQGDSLYLVNISGIYRITLGGSMWERLVEGELTDLRLPFTYVRGMAVIGDTLYALASNDGASKLLSFSYDASVTTVPTQTLSVYTLYPSRILEQAASVFQSRNPDYLVEVTSLLGEDNGATRQDVISALNVELLSGKGPDVLLLDGLPVDSYIQKGVLADLDQVVGPMLESGELMDNLFTPFYQDGAIYQAPTRVALPLAVEVSECESWQAMVDAVAKGLRLPPRTREGYIEMFLPVCLGHWFQEDGALIPERLASFLQDIEKLFDACGVQKDEQADQFKAAFISASTMAITPMEGYDSRLEELVQLGKRYDLLPTMFTSLAMDDMMLTQMEDTSSRLDFLPGQAGRVYAPSALAGVNARSAQREAALDFVGTLLSERVQDVDTFDGGTAVNRRSLEKKENDEGFGSSLISVTMITDPETGEGTFVSGRWPSRETRERVMALISQADTPYAPDETLLDLIRGALGPFCLGEMDPESAAQAVADKVRAYLAE